MFGPDPIDIYDPTPYWAAAYYGHYILGSVALIAAFVALASGKGRGLHRKAGLVFIAACFVLALTSASMLSDQFIPPLMMAAITSVYVIGGAYLALQKGTASVKAAEYVLSAVELAALTLFLSIAIPAALAGIIPITAPIIIGIIPLILLIGDANWFFNPAKRAQLRVARHLSRMIWGFVVVLRAPLVEIAAAGVPISPPVVIVGPIILAIAMHWYFQRKYGGFPFGRTV